MQISDSPLNDHKKAHTTTDQPSTFKQKSGKEQKVDIHQ